MTLVGDKRKVLTRIESSASGRIVINYRITEKCNYKCPYCWYKGRDFDSIDGDLYSINNVLNNLKFVIDYYVEREKRVFLFLTGGEPSIYPLSFYNNLFEIIAEKKIEKITLSTNFSADPSWFIGFAEKCKGNTFLEIKAAYHTSGCSIREYIDKIKLVKDSVDRFMAHFTFDDNNFIGIEKINEIKDLGVVLDVVPIHSKEDDDIGAYKITNPDLLDLISPKGTEKPYTAFYKNGESEKISVNSVKKMDFSLLKPLCHHSNITILNNKIGINCEYMRAIKRIEPKNWLDISVERSKEEMYDYLENKCIIRCDKGCIGLGSNCKPNLLEFPKKTLLSELGRVFSKMKKG